MKKILIVLLSLLPLSALAQSVTLEECLHWAHDNYPAVRQYELIEQSRDYTIDNAQKNWLPQVSVSLSGYALTDVLNTNQQMEAMGIDMKNVMGAGSITIRQKIYDGGRIKAGKDVARAQADVERSRNDVTLYDLNQRVEQLCFGILLIDEQKKQTILLQQDLGVSRKTVESMMKGGMANQSDMDAIDVEIEKSRQMIDAQQSSREAYLRMLGAFIGRKLAGDAVLEKPAALSILSSDINRPELQMFAAQEKLIDARRRQLDTQLLPTLRAFASGIYHTKMSDMINNGLVFGGLTLSWNIGSLYTRKNDIRKLDNQRQQIDVQRQTFLFNNHLQSEGTDGNIRAIQKQISHDDEIVRLRERIRSLSEKKVQLGTESVNEMIRDINAVSQARQQKAIHEIQLLQEMYRLKNQLGVRK